MMSRMMLVPVTSSVSYCPAVSGPVSVIFFICAMPVPLMLPFGCAVPACSMVLAKWSVPAIRPTLSFGRSKCCLNTALALCVVCPLCVVVPPWTVSSVTVTSCSKVYRSPLAVSLSSLRIQRSGYSKSSARLSAVWALVAVPAVSA